MKPVRSRLSRWTKPVRSRSHDEARREGLRGGPGVLEDHVGGAPVDPQPQVVLRRRRVVAAQHPERLEGRQVLRRVVRIDGAPQVGTEAQDDVDATGRHGRHAQAFQDGPDGRQVHVGPQLELEELVGDRALREDAELGQRHGRRLAHDERWRKTLRAWTDSVPLHPGRPALEC